MKTTLKLLSLSIFLFCLSGCASIFTKTTYPVTINSTPSEAKIVITDKKGYDIFQGITPAIVPLKSSAGFFSKAEYYLKISLPGYDDYLTTISADIDGWYFGNIFLGGLIGMVIIDPATGAMWKIDVQQINAQLRPSGEALQFYNINDIPEDWHPYLVQIN
jgi:hypothetical protein